MIPTSGRAIRGRGGKITKDGVSGENFHRELKEVEKCSTRLIFYSSKCADVMKC